MKLCAKVCCENNSSCEEYECRLWINYDKDLNCSQIAVEKNGAMTLKQVSDRLGVSYVRVSQIEKEAIKKLPKDYFTKKDTNYNIEPKTKRCSTS